jgi:hypothetical protein
MGGVLPANFEGWRCDWGELGCDGEDAVEFSVGVGCCYGGGDASEDSFDGFLS